MILYLITFVALWALKFVPRKPLPRETQLALALLYPPDHVGVLLPLERLGAAPHRLARGRLTPRVRIGHLGLLEGVGELLIGGQCRVQVEQLALGEP